MPRKNEILRIPPAQPPAFDIAEANRLITAAVASQGWLLDPDGTEPIHDVDKLRHAVFTSFTTNHIVTSTATRRSRKAFNELAAEAAVTKYALYVEIFPEGPAAQSPPGNEEEQAAKDWLAAYLWKLSTPTNRRAWLQSELDQSGLVVLETKVYPEDPTTPPQPGRYVTDVDQAMLEFLEHKVFGDVRKKLSETDAWLATFYKRNPGIALTASRKARAALKAAVDSAVNANPQYVRETLELATGDEDTASDS